MKANILVRGPNNVNYTGSLSSESNVYYKYIESVINQYKWAVKSNKNDQLVKLIKFEDLINIKRDIALDISKLIFECTNTNFVNHLVEKSKPSAKFVNRYVAFERDTHSYFKKNRQKHLPIEIRKDNFQDYTYSFERKFYYSLNDLCYFCSKYRFKYFFISIIKDFCYFPYILLFSQLIGFREIRVIQSLRKKLNLE